MSTAERREAGSGSDSAPGEADDPSGSDYLATVGFIVTLLIVVIVPCVGCLLSTYLTRLS